MGRSVVERVSFEGTEEEPQPAAVGVSRAAAGQPWLLRPSLEYQHAFDLCALELRRKEGPIAVLASSPFFARELLKRLGGCQVALIPVGEWALVPFAVEDWAGPELEMPAFEPASDADRPLSAAVWAEPAGPHGGDVLDLIRPHLAPDGSLFVICAGRLARFLPERQRDGDPAGPLRTRFWLRRSGFRLAGVYGFHGPLSILWGYASRLMGRLNRPDLADRFHFKMRARYMTHGWRSLLAPVCVIAARKY